MSVVAAELRATIAPSWRDVVTLLKLRIDALIVATALAAAVAAGERSAGALALLAAACLLASAGASSINHYVDRDIDARMRRTAGRPLPSGRIADPRFALWLGISLVVASQAFGPVIGLLPALYLLAGAATYAVVYSWWLKPRTPYSIVLGGAAGSFAALAGWETAATTASVGAAALAAVLFLWTPSHFWSLAIALEDDYRAGRVPMLPVVAGAARAARAVLLNTAALVAFSLVLGAFVGWPYLLLAVPAGAWFTWESVRLWRSPDKATAFRTFKLSGLYLLLLLVGLCLSPLA